MKKDIEWLKEKVQKRIDKLPRTYSGSYSEGSRDAYHLALQDINQLDEPEVLSQELPVIPNFVADFIEVRKGTDAYFLKYILCVAAERSEQEEYTKAYDWISANDETFARAWLDGYEVEEEPLYLVSATGMRIGFWFLCKDNDDNIAIGTNKDYYEADWDSLKLTEQEIKDFDPRYWAFAELVDKGVEEAPLYHALIKGYELLKNDGIHRTYNKNNDDVFFSESHSPDDNFPTEMSKNGWSGLGINYSNADFGRAGMDK